MIIPMVAILSFALGILCYRLYQSRLIRYFPEQNPLKITAFFSELSNQKGRTQLVITIENLGDSPVYLEGWFIRVLNPSGFLRQIFHSPQNLVHTLKPHEKRSIDIRDIGFLRGQTLYTIVLRDVYGREWSLEESQIIHLRKDLFWSSFS